MREELSNLYFDGGSGTEECGGRGARRTFTAAADAAVRDAFAFKLFLFICFSLFGKARNGIFPLLCVSWRDSLRLVLRFFCSAQWHPKLWFTIPLEDYTEWTIKAWGHNTTTAPLHENFCDIPQPWQTIIYSNHEKWKSFFCCGYGSRATVRSAFSGRAQLNILCMKNQLHYHICLKFLLSPFSLAKTSHTCETRRICIHGKLGVRIGWQREVLV